MRCQLDPKVTAESILNYRTEVGEMWGSACGRNRGVFVLDPADGHTYGASVRCGYVGLRTVDACWCCLCPAHVVIQSISKCLFVCKIKPDCGHFPASWGVADAGSLLTATPPKAVKYVHRQIRHNQG